MVPTGVHVTPLSKPRISPGQHLAGAGLQEAPEAVLDQAVDLRHPLHARDDLLDTQPLRLGAAGDAPSGDVGVYRERRIVEGEPGHHLGEPHACGFDQRRVKRTGHLQRHEAARARGRARLLGRRQPLGSAGQHHLCRAGEVGGPGAVHVGQRRGYPLRSQADHRGHAGRAGGRIGAAAGGFHRLAARLHDAEQVTVGDHAGRGKGGILTDRKAGVAVRLDAALGEHPGNCHVDQGNGDLGAVGCLQIRGAAAKQQRRQVQAGGIGRLRKQLPDARAGLEQVLAHAGILSALSGK